MPLTEEEWAAEHDWIECPAPARVLSVQYRRLDADGRMETAYHQVSPPPNSHVRDVLDLLREELNLSPRQPIELRLWGATLPHEKQIQDLAIKETSSRLSPALELAIKPESFFPLEGAAPPTRLRVRGAKLQMAIPVEGLTSESTVLDVKRLLAASMRANPIYVCQNGAAEDERTGTMELRKGEQVRRHEDGGAAAGGGKKSGVLRVRRARDGEIGNVNEADVLAVQPLAEEHLVLIFHAEVRALLSGQHAA